MDGRREDVLQLAEGGPLLRLVRPALQQDGVEVRGTAGGQCQPLTVLQLADHVGVLDTLERLYPEHQYFPDTDP